MQEKTALIFDDDNDYRALMTEILTEKNFSVSAFSDPLSFHPHLDEDFRCTRETPCSDIIVTDNRMPGMSGLDFLEHLTAKGCKLPNHHKAVISGSWTAEELTRAERLGCKVFQKTTPIDAIFHWLDEQTTPGTEKHNHTPSGGTP